MSEQSRRYGELLSRVHEARDEVMRKRQHLKHRLDGLEKHALLLESIIETAQAAELYDQVPKLQGRRDEVADLIADTRFELEALDDKEEALLSAEGQIRDLIASVADTDTLEVDEIPPVSLSATSAIAPPAKGHADPISWISWPQSRLLLSHVPGIPAARQRWLWGAAIAALVPLFVLVSLLTRPANVPSEDVVPGVIPSGTSARPRVTNTPPVVGQESGSQVRTPVARSAERSTPTPSRQPTRRAAAPSVGTAVKAEAAPTPTRQPTPAATRPTPAPTREPNLPTLSPGGLAGNRAEWESTHGLPEDSVGSFVQYSDGSYLVGYLGDRIWHVTRSWPGRNGLTFVRAREEIRDLLPRDVVLQQQDQTFRSGTLEVYKSDSISSAFPRGAGDPWFGGERGIITVLYRSDGRGISAVVVQVGGLTPER